MLCYSSTALILGERSLHSYIPEASEEVQCSKRTPALIVSDNAKTFKGAWKEIRTLFRHPEVRAELEKKGIEWRFNIARAPWWGGFFERMVKSVKQCLKKAI